MAEAMWHQFAENCKDCGTLLSTVAVSFLAIGHVKFKFRCEKCEKEYEFEQSVAECLRIAREADIRQEFRELTTKNSKIKTQ